MNKKDNKTIRIRAEQLDLRQGRENIQVEKSLAGIRTGRDGEYTYIGTHSSVGHRTGKRKTAFEREHPRRVTMQGLIIKLDTNWSDFSLADTKHVKNS